MNVLQTNNQPDFMRFIEKHRKGTKFPIQKDLDAMTEGILRVHDAYNIDLQEVSGRIGFIFILVLEANLNCFLKVNKRKIWIHST